MCVMKWESLVGGCFWENRKLLFGKTESLGWKCKNFDFLHICKPQIYSQLSICPHQIFSFHRTNITCNFPFYRLLAAASPSTNRPKSKSGYLAIVSLKHGRLVRVRSQYSLFRRSPTRQNLPPATFDASERLHYGSPFAPVQNMAVRFAALINFRKKF